MWRGRRGEQEQVAARVRAVLAAHPAARAPGGPVGGPVSGPVSRGTGGDAGGAGGLAALSDAEMRALFADDIGLAPDEPVRTAEAEGGPPPRARDDDRAVAMAAASLDGAPAAGRTLAERLLAGRPIQARASRRSAVAVGVAALVAALLTGWWVFASRPESVAAPSGSGAVASARSATPRDAGPSSGPLRPRATGMPGVAASSGAGEVLVDVEGRVRRPGIYRLPAGARVADALAAAGGARAHVSTTTLNLAARLSDGQQILVGAPVAPQGSAGSAGSPAAGGAPSAGGSSGPEAPVSLNAAGPDQLQTLPGVGPVLAQHIVDWRTEHGGFTSVEQLNDVAGIGDVKFAALRDLVTL